MPSVYELLVLTVPQAATEGKDHAKDKVEALITKQKGKILTSEDWGERLLTFPIKKYDRGIYLLYSVEMLPTSVRQLDAKLTLETTVLRHLLVKKQKAVKKQAEV